MQRSTTVRGELADADRALPLQDQDVADQRNALVMGRPAGEIGAGDYTGPRRGALLHHVAAAWSGLRSRYDVVIAEGAGSPAEINLRDGDIANLGLAQAVGAPVVLIGDIDRGGVFASLIGTLACVSAEDRRLFRGFVVNKFRGDPSVLRPGLDGYRREVLAGVAAATERRFVLSDMDWAGRRSAQLDRIADLLEEHVDCDALARLAGCR